MTTCAECLAGLSTARLSEIRSDSRLVAHYSTCEHCASIVEDLRYAESRLALALSEARPFSLPEELAGNASIIAERRHRRTIARWLRGGLAVAGFAVFGMFMESRTMRDRAPVRTETIRLECIDSQQALDLATPYLRSSGARASAVPGLRTVTIAGVKNEFETAKAEILKQDAFCQLPNRPVPVPIPSAGTPGKD